MKAAKSRNSYRMDKRKYRGQSVTKNTLVDTQKNQLLTKRYGVAKETTAKLIHRINVPIIIAAGREP